MVTAISAFGAFHTAVSVSAIGFGIWELVRHGKIDLRTVAGKLYFATMFVGSTTAFGIFRHSGFTPGHALGLITLALLFAAALAAGGNWFGRLARYVETFSLSASFFLLWIFTTTETLTRLPVNQPVASGPTDPFLLTVHLGLLVAFVLGTGYQLLGLAMRRSQGWKPSLSTTRG